MVYHSAIKESEIMPFAATWMDLRNVILGEVCQTEKEKYCMTSLLRGIKKEMIQMNLLTKQETHKLREGTYGCQGRRWMRGRDN